MYPNKTKNCSSYVAHIIKCTNLFCSFYVAHTLKGIPTFCVAAVWKAQADTDKVLSSAMAEPVTNDNNN